MTPLVRRSLGSAQRVLLAGCGGGYDVFGALPLWHDLRAEGRTVHLASLSFTYLAGLDGDDADPSCPSLHRVTGAQATTRDYCPEAWLAQKLEVPIWCFDKTGVRPLAAAYRRLVERLGGVDAIVLVDGGIDALLRGDETSLGTPSEDLATLAAVDELDVAVKILACVGLGAEMRDGIPHAQAFERIAELTKRGAYLGASALVAGTPATDAYVGAVKHVFAAQMDTRRSHVHRVICDALEGKSGAEGPHVWLSPLLPIMWFFSLRDVIDTHLFVRRLRATESIWQVAAIIEAVRAELDVRARTSIPI